MIKNILATAALVAASATFASAATIITTFSSSNTVANASNVATTTASEATLLGETVTTQLSVSSGNVYNSVSLSTSTVTNTTATTALAELGIDLGTDATIYGAQGGQSINTLTVTFSGLTAGETYTITAIVGEYAGTASTFSYSAGTLVSGTYYDLTSSTDTGTDLGSSFSITSANGYAVISEVTASDDGTISFQITTKGTVLLAAVTAVPEPSSFGLLAGVGALALVAARRRRSHKA